MNKWIAIPVIAVLAIGVIGVGYLYWQQTNKLGEAESEIVALEGNVSTLEGNVSTLEVNLTESEVTVTTLEADLETANSRINSLQADVSTQQTINLTLTSELKMVKDPRHFNSIQELTDWLHEDDTDTRFADESNAQKACILQVRALRDGYLLSTFIVDEEGACFAVIEDEYWAINPEDDDTEFGYYMQPLPSHPLPLD